MKPKSTSAPKKTTATLTWIQYSFYLNVVSEKLAEDIDRLLGHFGKDALGEIGLQRLKAKWSKSFREASFTIINPPSLGIACYLLGPYACVAVLVECRGTRKHWRKWIQQQKDLIGESLANRDQATEGAVFIDLDPFPADTMHVYDQMIQHFSDLRMSEERFIFSNKKMGVGRTVARDWIVIAPKGSVEAAHFLFQPCSGSLPISLLAEYALRQEAILIQEQCHDFQAKRAEMPVDLWTEQVNRWLAQESWLDNAQNHATLACALAPAPSRWKQERRDELGNVKKCIDRLNQLVGATSVTRKSPEMAPAELAQQAVIGILTALPKECAAMRLMLENELRWQAPGDGGGRDYYLGEIPASDGGKHVVAIALLPDMGNNSAAISATRLLHHFPSVRRIIMCGIAGGVPKPGDTEHDVRLGDIVVSNRNGVVQYDLIKERPDGTTEHRHPPRPPDAELLGAVRHFLAEEELGRRPWEAFLSRGAKMQNLARPADNLDARGITIKYPEDRARIPGQPRIFHSTIAAANKLLKNRKHRDYLGATFGVKAIEMEGSGVADATWSDGAGYLVVRGICDYCDKRKGDVWHGAAAIAAAAYVRALISSMPNRSSDRKRGSDASDARSLDEEGEPQPTAPTAPTAISTSRASPVIATTDPDHEVYAALIDTIVKALQLDSWSWFIDNAIRPFAVHENILNARGTLNVRLLSTIWSKHYPELNEAIKNLIRSFDEYISYYEMNIEKNDVFFRPNKNYARFNNSNYDKYATYEQLWMRRCYWLICKYIVSLNHFTDMVRRYIDPQFYRKRGYFLIEDQLGVWSNMQPTVYLPTKEDVEKGLRTNPPPDLVAEDSRLPPGTGKARKRGSREVP